MNVYSSTWRTKNVKCDRGPRVTLTMGASRNSSRGKDDKRDGEVNSDSSHAADSRTNLINDVKMAKLYIKIFNTPAAILFISHTVQFMVFFATLF